MQVWCDYEFVDIAVLHSLALVIMTSGIKVRQQTSSYTDRTAGRAENQCDVIQDSSLESQAAVGTELHLTLYGWGGQAISLLDWHPLLTAHY